MNLVRNCMVKPLSILSELSMEIKTNLSPRSDWLLFIFKCCVRALYVSTFKIGAWALYTTKFLQILLLKKRHLISFYRHCPNFFINYAFLENMLKL